MSQAYIVPEPNFDADHVTAVDDSGNSVEYAGREARPAVADEDNVGGLKPIPLGYPDGAVSVEAIVRTAGNAGGARVGWKDQSGSLWKGKSAAHVMQDVQFLEYGNITTTKVMRPKSYELASGDLLVTALYTGGDPTLTIAVRCFVVNVSGVSSPQTVSLGTNPFTAIVAVDIVQYPDTNEIVMIVLGYGTSNILKMMRFTAKQPASGTVPTFQASAVEYSSLATVVAGSGFIPTGMAIEVMASGRLAMLVHYYGTGAAGIARSYSDDRGETWAPFAAVSTFVETVNGGATYVLGGVDIKRNPSTGSLMALVGIGNANTVTMLNVGAKAPSLLPMVSDDGETWVGLVSMTEVGAGSTFTGVQRDWPVGCDGVTEGAIAIGDDGITRFFGCFHGDTAGTFLDGTSNSGAIYDDLVTLALRKVEITSRDNPPAIANGISAIGTTGVTTTDAFGTTLNPTIGLYQPATMNPVTMWRMGVMAGGGSLNLNNSAATFKGARTIEAINWRGAIWLIVCFEDTANAVSSLGLIRCNPWSELQERPYDTSSATNILLGGTYRQGFVAYNTPSGVGLTKTGTGAETVEGQSGDRGAQLDTTGVGATTFSLGSVEGTKGKPHFLRYKLKAISGAGVAATDCGVRAKIFSAAGGAGAVAMSILDLRLSTTQLRLYDAGTAAAAVATVTATFTAGAEVLIAFSDYRTFLGAWYKIPTTDPEDEVWVSMGISAGTQLSTQADSGNEDVSFGTFSAADVVSAWQNVHFTRGTATTSFYAAYLNTGTKAYDAATPVLDDVVVDTIGYDDGFTHGTRAPKSNSSPMYLRKNMRMVWVGAAGYAQDNWTVDGGYSFDVSRVCKLPVRDYWRSADDGAIANLLWDAGANGAGLAVSYVALFGINAYRFYFQIGNDPTWAAPGASLLVDSSGAAARYRHEFRVESGDMVLKNNNYVVQLNSNALGSSGKLESGRFRATAQRQWYVWAEDSEQAYRILDNDGTRLIMQDPLATTDVDDFVVVYPDWIVFPVTIATAGYRYARVHMPAQNTAENYFKCGYAVAGQAFDLAAPHPNWGWSRRIIPAVSVTETEAGFSYVSKIGESRQQFTLGFTGMRGRKDRASAGAAPLDQAGYERLVSMVERMDWGQRVGAFLTQYKDELDNTSNSLFGQRSFNVIPARISSPIDLAHQSSEGCHTDAVVQAIHDLGALVVDEVL